MADAGSLFLAIELVDNCPLLDDMLEENDELVVFSAVCCFMRRNLTRICDYFERTIPRYLPDQFKQHFRMTRETCEILSREIMQTGRIPTENPSGRPVIDPEKQILVFLWRIANQEPVRAVADRFDLTYSSIDRAFRRVVQATVSLTRQYINGQTVSHISQISKHVLLFYLKRSKINLLLYSSYAKNYRKSNARYKNIF